MVVLPSILPVVMQRVHPPAGGVNCTPLLCVVDAFDWLTVYCGPGPMVRARGSFAGMDNLLFQVECSFYFLGGWTAESFSNCCVSGSCVARSHVRPLAKAWFI